METIKSTTKRGENFVNAYNRSANYCLMDCYGRYSTEKARAERDCRQKAENEGGNGFKIISFNTFGFTCGWLVPDGLRVETACGSYLVK